MTKETILTSLLITIVLAGSFGLRVALAQEAIMPTLKPVVLSTPAESLPIPEVNLQSGARHKDVMKLQEALKNLGYLAPEVESVENFGQKTREALIKFQKDHNLPAFGFFGPSTRKVLREKLDAEGLKFRDADIVCMKSSVEKRENSLLADYDTYSSKVKSSRETRKADLLAAWSIQEPKERHNAIKQAWEKYRNSVKSVRDEWIRSRNLTWKQFAQDTINCKSPSTGESQALEENVSLE